MQRLGNVRSAVIYNHHVGLGFLKSEVCIRRHSDHIIADKIITQIKIQKSRRYSFNLGKYMAAFKLSRHILGYLHRRLVMTLCSCHGSVTLVFAQVGSVGYGYPA